MAGNDPGLCATCAFGRQVVSGKGSVFWLCERSREDPRFRKYPALPVVRCPGYAVGGGSGRTGARSGGT
ncbi:hypothetical protein [Tepidiforma sp.]|uniref:hypothetical protein n=1 Tax=Tepidiforma sp. TaxID=2682230 RepID=UPI002ADD3A04|nr:hypothetical protein [Tepidiforma sp.]